MKHEMCGVVMEEFVSLKPNICSILASDSSKYKKAKGVNRNTVPKKVTMNQKMFYWIKYNLDMQWKEFKVKITEERLMKSTKCSLSCCDDKIHILNDGTDVLALGY